MRISTRSEYGLRALMELGIETRGALSLRDIAARQNISLDYLEQIMPALKSAGLIQARRGAQGGYQLARPASEITMLDILSTLEGSLDPMACLSSQPLPPELDEMNNQKAVATRADSPVLDTCGASGSCAVQEVWREVKTAMETVLRRLTLAELIERQEARYGGPIRTYSEHEIMKLVVLN
jgi:Rrf2 family protein